MQHAQRVFIFWLLAALSPMVVGLSNVVMIIVDDLRAMIKGLDPKLNQVLNDASIS